MSGIHAPRGTHVSISQRIGRVFKAAHPLMPIRRRKIYDVVKVTLLLAAYANQREFSPLADIKAIVLWQKLGDLDARRQGRIKKPYPQVTAGDPWNQGLRDQCAHHNFTGRSLKGYAYSIGWRHMPGGNDMARGYGRERMAPGLLWPIVIH